MTNKEAAKIIGQMKPGDIFNNVRQFEALAMGIDALECVQSSAFSDGMKKGREQAIYEAKEKIGRYGSVWMSYSDGMTKEEIATEALKATKNAMISVLDEMKNSGNNPESGFVEHGKRLSEWGEDD